MNKNFKFTKRKGGHNSTIITFDTKQLDGLHIGTKCDFVVLLLKQFRDYFPEPLLNKEQNFWAQNNIKEYNKQNLGNKTLLELNYHRAIMSYLVFGGINVISDFEEVIEVLEYYWREIKK